MEELSPQFQWSYPTVETPADLISNYSCQLAEIYARRGYTSANAVDRNFKLSLWHDPAVLPDILKLLELIARFARSGELLYVYSDYDADGCLSLFMMISFLQKLNVNVVVRQANRHNGGYGISEENVQEAYQLGTNAILTLDCGSNDVLAMESADKLGIPTYVLDHHLIDSVLPESIVVVNPQRSDSEYPFTGLCTAALVFKFISLYAKNHGIEKKYIAEYLPYAAVALLADQMPMRDEARAMTVHGLRNLGKVRHVGLRTLLQVLDLKPPFNEKAIHFGLNPVLNAPGRLSDPDIVVDLLLETDPNKALELAYSLMNVNQQRRDETDAATEQAISMVGEHPMKAVLVVGHPDWNHGICGIVSSRLCEKYKRPTLVFGGADNGEMIGSGRTIEGTSIMNILAPVKHRFLRLGGHEGACGATIQINMLDILADEARQLEVPDVKVDVIPVDLLLTIDDIDIFVDETLPVLQPFGPENAEPILYFGGLQIIECKEQFEKPGMFRLKLVDDQNRYIKAKTQLNLSHYIGRVVDVIGHLNGGEFKGHVWRLINIVDICDVDLSPLHKVIRSQQQLA